MGILDLIKRNRDDEDAEELEEAVEEERGDDDEDGGEEEGGLFGGLKRLGGRGVAVRGLLGKVMHRGGDDEDDDEDEDDDAFAAPAAPQAPQETAQGQSVPQDDNGGEDVTIVANAINLDQIRDGGEEPVAPVDSVASLLGDAPEVVPETPSLEPDISVNETPESGVEDFAFGTIFDEKEEIDEKLRDLASDQETLQAKDLVVDLKALLSDLEDLV